MPNKPTASNPSIRVPKRNYVQEQAEQDGYTRVLDENGTPMLIKPMPSRPDVLQDIVDRSNDPNRKKAKVIGPKPNIQIASARG